MSREGAIGLASSGLAIAALVVDHLVPGDVFAFLVTSAIALTIAAAIFGGLIPRTKVSVGAPALAAARGMMCSVVAVLSIPTLFVGLPFVLGGGGVALGLLGLSGDRKRLAMAALALGALVVAFSVGVYAVLGDSDG